MSFLLFACALECQCSFPTCSELGGFGPARPHSRRRPGVPARQYLNIPEPGPGCRVTPILKCLSGVLMRDSRPKARRAQRIHTSYHAVYNRVSGARVLRVGQ